MKIEIELTDEMLAVVEKYACSCGMEHVVVGLGE